jgi:hypothetical protein
MEKILDLHIRETILVRNPLHNDQFAFQDGKSTVTALHNLVYKVERSLNNKEIALGVFLDIEGAFDNTSYDSIERAATRKGVETSTTGWIRAMLESRRITAKIGVETVTATAITGCPQGGVLSPLLWSLVIDDLLTTLTLSGYEVQGYADDLVIIVRGKYESVLSGIMQTALNKVHNWCLRGLSVNPAKTIIVPFTRRRVVHLMPPVLNGNTISFSTEVKYLGLILDRKLTWNAHLEETVGKATRA